MTKRTATLAICAALGLIVLAAGAAAGGSSRAHGTFVDAAGNTVGWVQLVEDARGIVHVNVHVDGLTPGKHGIHVRACLQRLFRVQQQEQHGPVRTRGSLALDFQEIPEGLLVIGLAETLLQDDAVRAPICHSVHLWSVFSYGRSARSTAMGLRRSEARPAIAGAPTGQHPPPPANAPIICGRVVVMVVTIVIGTIFPVAIEDDPDHLGRIQ